MSCDPVIANYIAVTDHVGIPNVEGLLNYLTNK